MLFCRSSRLYLARCFRGMDCLSIAIRPLPPPAVLFRLNDLHFFLPEMISLFFFSFFEDEEPDLSPPADEDEEDVWYILWEMEDWVVLPVVWPVDLAPTAVVGAEESAAAAAPSAEILLLVVVLLLMSKL